MQIRGNHPNDPASRFIPRGESHDSIKTEIPKRKKGDKREWKQKTKTKARFSNSRVERGDLSPVAYGCRLSDWEVT